MSSLLVINADGPETRVALVEDGFLGELYIERKRERGIAGLGPAQARQGAGSRQGPEQVRIAHRRAAQGLLRPDVTGDLPGVEDADREPGGRTSRRTDTAKYTMDCAPLRG